MRVRTGRFASMPAAPLFALTRCHACCMFSLLTTSATVVIRVGCLSTTRPDTAHPCRTHHRPEAYGMPFLLSAFWPSSRRIGTTMPSADFCLCPALTSGIASAGYALTRHVSMLGAIGVRREMLSCSCFPRGAHIRRQRLIRLGLVRRV
jgi:hypothetical protein